MLVMRKICANSPQNHIQILIILLYRAGHREETCVDVYVCMM